jgi:hypothetical protein
MGIRDINALKGDSLMHGATEEPESTPLESVPDQNQDLPDKPAPEPVQDVQDDELDTLESEGESDVSELPQEEADADDTVDNEENDVPPAASPTQQQGADPGVSS